MHLCYSVRMGRTLYDIAASVPITIRVLFDLVVGLKFTLCCKLLLL